MNTKAFAVLVGSMFISMLGMGIVSPFLPIYANKLGASTLEVGLVQAGFNLTGIFTVLFFGRLSDRFGRKIFLSCGLAILAISPLGLMSATKPIQLIVWRFIQGLGASAHLPIAQAYLGDITPVGNEGKWTGYFNAVLFAGIGAGPLFGGVITDAINIRATFLFMSALNTLALIANFIFLKEMPRKIAVRGHTSLIAPLKSSVMRGAFSYNLSVGVGTASMMAFIPLLANKRIGLSASLIGLLLAARTPVSILQSYTGRLADRWNRRSMVLLGGVASILSIMLLPKSIGFWTLLVAYICVMLGQAFGTPASNAYVVQEGRTYGMGATTTMYMMAMHIGNGIGPVFLGGVADWLGLEFAFYIAGICMAIGVAFFGLIVRDSSIAHRR
jgi:MFS transporter, DHA1 family, multidrug resistance protein